VDSKTKNDLDLRSEFELHSLEEWKQAVIDGLRGADFDKVMRTKTYEGITLKPIYTREDLQGKPWLESTAGQAPYLRGSNADGFTGQSWIVAQRQDEPDAAELNSILLHELQRGLGAANIKINPDTLKIATETTDARGLRLHSLEDLSKALEDVELRAIPIMMLGNRSMILLQSMLYAWAEENEMPLDQLTGAVACDPFLDEKPDFDILYKMQVAGKKHSPLLKTILLDSYKYEAMGASATEELAYFISAAHKILGELIQRGAKIDDIAPSFVLKLSLGSNFFMEIAKIRAARMLWAELIKTYGGNEESRKIHIHAATSSFNKSRYDVWVNMLRTTTESFAGVVGMVDSMEISAFDSTMKPADEFAARIARNQQLILDEESHFSKVIDPAGGCWYIESLVAELCDLSWKKMQAIETEGGFEKFTDSGKLHEVVKELARKRIDMVNSRRDVKVGVNMFANPQDTLEIAKAEAPAKKVAEVEGGIDLSELKAHKDDAVKLFDTLIKAWQQGATLRELAKALDLTIQLREYPCLRVVQEVEALRQAIEALPQKPVIHLLNMGKVLDFKARADFSSAFFQMSGFELINPAGYESCEAAIRAASESKAKAVCICSTDALYEELVPVLCEGLKKLESAPIIILAGYPKDKVESYKEAGVDIFIHIRANAYETNKEIINKMGVEL
jgi:methylmalonyl-CoA mutase